MVAVGSPIAAPGVVVNILGSMAGDGVRCALEDVGVTLVGSLNDGILVYGEKQLGGGGGSRIVYLAPNWSRCRFVLRGDSAGKVKTRDFLLL
jgi:hypothetical protein